MCTYSKESHHPRRHGKKKPEIFLSKYIFQQSYETVWYGVLKATSINVGATVGATLIYFDLVNGHTFRLSSSHSHGFFCGNSIMETECFHRFKSDDNFRHVSLNVSLTHKTTGLSRPCQQPRLSTCFKLLTWSLLWQHTSLSTSHLTHIKCLCISKQACLATCFYLRTRCFVWNKRCQLRRQRRPQDVLCGTRGLL